MDAVEDRAIADGYLAWCNAAWENRCPTCLDSLEEFTTNTGICPGDDGLIDIEAAVPWAVMEIPCNGG